MSEQRSNLGLRAWRRVLGHLPFPSYELAAADARTGRWFAFTHGNRVLVALAPTAVTASALWSVVEERAVLVASPVALMVYALSLWFVPHAQRTSISPACECSKDMWLVCRSTPLTSISQIMAAETEGGRTRIALRDGRVVERAASEPLRVVTISDPALRWRRSAPLAEVVPDRDVVLAVRLVREGRRHGGPVPAADFGAVAIRYLRASPERVVAEAIRRGVLRKAGQRLEVTAAGELWLRSSAVDPDYVVLGVRPTERSPLDYAG